MEVIRDMVVLDLSEIGHNKAKLNGRKGFM